ncbi:MAG: hypothetical protein AB9M53_04885 [Leptothrix sp. (in: b-proteobacteria)]
MAQKSAWKDKFSFINASVVSNDLILFLLSSDELASRNIPSAMFLAWKNGAWLDAGNQRWLCAGLGSDDSTPPRLVAVGEFGEVFVRGGGIQSNEKVTPKLKTVSDHGPLRGVRTIGHDVYVVGMGRQVYMRSNSRWSALDTGLGPMHGRADVTGFEAIAGFASDELYAVGWNGEIWHFDGRSWIRADSPSNLILNDVCCAGDGKVYAVGQKGTLVIGRGDKWELVEGLDFDDDLWSVAWHHGVLYLCSTRELLTFDGKTLDAADFGADEPETFYKLATGDGVLCSVGAKDVMLHDGQRWIRLE